MLSHIGICVIDVLVSAVGAMLTVDPLRKEKNTRRRENERFQTFDMFSQFVYSQWYLFH